MDAVTLGLMTDWLRSVRRDAWSRHVRRIPRRCGRAAAAAGCTSPRTSGCRIVPTSTTSESARAPPTTSSARVHAPSAAVIIVIVIIIIIHIIGIIIHETFIVRLLQTSCKNKMCLVLVKIIKVFSSLWPPYVIGGHYIFALWFLSSIFFFLSFFSSPNLTGRRLDVYHTLAHGVALVRI